MLEITVRRHGGIGLAAQTFQFENDALQAFFTNGGEGAAFNVAGVRVLGAPFSAVGYGSKEVMPKQSAAEIAGDGPRTPVDPEEQERMASEEASRPQGPDTKAPKQGQEQGRDQLGIRTPLQETARAKAADTAKPEKK